MQIIVLVLLVIVVLALLRHVLKTARPDLLPDTRKLTFYGLIALLVILALTGRLAWILAVVGGLVAATVRLLPLLVQLAPALAKVFGRGYGESASTGGSPPPQGGGSMSREDALQILGLEPGASRAAVIEAHRRLIQKLHPDRGGSDFLAAQINQARRLLLGE